MQTFSELPYGVRMHQLLAIKVGLRAYAKHGLRVNRMYTPKRMMEMAAKLTGQKFKARDYAGAADALERMQNRISKEERERASIASAFGQAL